MEIKENNLKELIEKFKAIRDALPEVLPDVATSMSLTAKAIAERTIKDKGFGELYSDTEVPAWFFKGKELSILDCLVINSTREKRWKERHFKDLSKNSIKGYEISYNHCKSILNLKIKDIKAIHMQNLIDSLGKNHATLKILKSLLNLFFKYAMEMDIIQKRL